MVLRTFFRKWFCRRSEKIHEFFINATRVYILQGEEDARCAAVAAAKMAAAKQRRALARELENIAANISQSYPDKSRRKMLAERALSLKESIESCPAKPGSDGEEKKRLSFLNKEYFSSLNEVDPSVFCRRYPKLF
jgi:hypothetical protein